MLPFSGAWFIDGWNLKVDAAPQLLTDSPTATGATPASVAASAPGPAGGS
jgi:hypothetical protein